jgi:hypothetical protein
METVCKRCDNRLLAAFRLLLRKEQAELARSGAGRCQETSFRTMEAPLPGLWVRVPFLPSALAA